MQVLLKYRTYLGIALTIVVVAAIAFLRPDDKFSQTRRDTALDKFWLVKAKNTGHYNLLILGDSRIFRGVDPAVITHELPGITAFNFGFSAGGLNKEVFKAAEQRLLQDQGEKIILLGVTPRSLTQETVYNAKMRQEIHRPWSAMVERVYLYPVIEPFYPSDVFNSLKNKDKEQLVYLTVGHDDGFMEMGKTVTEDTTYHLSAYKDIFAVYKTDPKLIADLLEQTREWKTQNIKVYGFRPPTTRAMLELENEMSGFDQATFVPAFEEAGGKWINVDINQYHCFDGSHINDTSAVKLSKYLAGKIKEDL